MNQQPPSIPSSTYKAEPGPSHHADAGHLGSFLVSGISILLYNFFYYGLRANLIFLLFEYTDETKSFELYAAYGALLYLSPLVMGIVGDMFFERRTSTVIGTGLVAFGFIALYLSVTQHIGSPIIGMAIAAVGSGLFKTANFALFFNAFPIRGKQLTTTYLAYLLINVGAFLSPLVLGVLFADSYQIAPLVIGILVLLMSVGLFLFNHFGVVPSEAPQHRSSISRMSMSPLLGGIFTGVVCLAMVALGYGLVEGNVPLFRLLMGISAVIFSLGILVVMIVLGRASVLAVLTMIFGVVAISLFWASYESVWGALYSLEVVRSSAINVQSFTVIITMVGCLALGAIGIAVPILKKSGTALVGGMMTFGWVIVLGLLLFFGAGLFSENGGSLFLLLVLLGVTELLIAPIYYLWIYRITPPAFRSAGFGLAFYSSSLAALIGGYIHKNDSWNWAGMEEAATAYLPWMGGMAVFFVVLVVLWAVLRVGEEK